MLGAFKGDNVCTVTEILNGTVKLENKNVAVIGSGMTGLETSELLCAQGNKVTIVEMADAIAPGAYFQHVDDAIPKLKAADTTFLTSSKLVKINPNGIEIENTKSGATSSIAVDFVVLSMGCRPDTSLYDELINTKDRDYKVYKIGDCVKVGRIANATESAYQLAIKLNR